MSTYLEKLAEYLNKKTGAKVGVIDIIGSKAKALHFNKQPDGFRYWQEDENSHRVYFSSSAHNPLTVNIPAKDITPDEVRSLVDKLQEALQIIHRAQAYAEIGDLEDYINGY